MDRKYFAIEWHFFIWYKKKLFVCLKSHQVQKINMDNTWVWKKFLKKIMRRHDWPIQKVDEVGNVRCGKIWYQNFLPGNNWHYDCLYQAYSWKWWIPFSVGKILVVGSWHLSHWLWNSIPRNSPSNLFTSLCSQFLSPIIITGFFSRHIRLKFKLKEKVNMKVELIFHCLVLVRKRG